MSDWVQSWDGEGKGRLWRFLPRDRSAEDARLATEVRELLAGDWRTNDDPRLVDLLGHPDRRIRLEAQWELVRRGATARLADVVSTSAASPRARIHAAQGLAQRLRSGDRAAARPLGASGGTVPRYPRELN